jgi:hypothetical protein
MELLREERERGGEHDRATDSLSGTGDDEEDGTRRQRAQEGGEGEQAEPDAEHQPPSEQIGQCPCGQEQRGEGESVGVDHPLDLREARLELLGHARERHVDDRDVEQEHERRRAHDDQRPPLAFHRGGW